MARRQQRASTDLLERTDELSLIEETLAGSTEGGRVLVVEGPAGIGKSRLLDAAVELASDRGMSALLARGGVLERSHAFGIARQLLVGPVVRATPSERQALLADAAGLATTPLGLDAGDQTAGRARGSSALHGLHWLCANLADRQPLLMVVDDAQWGDAASLRFLAYLTRRLEDLAILLALGWRSGEPEAPQALLEEVVAEPATIVVRPQPLSSAGVRALLGSAVGDDRVTPAVADACVEVSGGNPFLVRGVAAELRGADAADERALAAQIRTMAPRQIAGRLLRRIAQLGAPAQRLAEALAVLGVQTPLNQGAAVAALDAADAGLAADALADADVLAPGRPLAFAHPLVRSIVYDDLAPSARASLHARAARLVADSGADPREAAAHLLETEPLGEPWASEVLVRAATRAGAEGAAEASVAYATRGLAETPAREHRVALLRARSLARLELGDADSGQDAADALALSDSAEGIAQSAMLLRRVLTFSDRPADVVDFIGPTVARLEETDVDLARAVEAVMVGGAVIDIRSVASASARLQTIVDAVRAGTFTHPHALAIAAWSLATSAAAPAGEILPLAERSATGLAALPPAERMHQIGPRMLALQALDAVAVAADVCDAGIAQARAAGSRVELAGWASFRSLNAYHQGALAAAEADARVALGATGLEAGAFFTLPAAGALLLALVERDRLAEAERVLEELPAQDPPMTTLPMTTFAYGRARLRLAQGELAAARAELLALGDLVAALRVRFFPAFPWRTEAALAALALGDRDEAARLADEDLLIARTVGARRALGIALRASGLVQGGQEGQQLLHEAVETLDGTPARLDYGRALVDLGAARRRARDRKGGREMLREGLQIAMECGATALANQARDELVASGARPRRDAIRGRDALTGSELRVARMAAEGLSNRQIAQALFVTRKTVETHLSHAYKKLDIGSREELASALAERSGSVGA